MRAYTAILSARFRALLQYRAVAAAGVGTQVFWGLIRMMILTAFYEGTTRAQPMQLAEVVTYIWLGQAFIRLTIVGVDREVEQFIRSGNVAYEMLRPVDLYAFWYSRAIAAVTAPTILRCVPILLLATVMGWVRWPGPAALGAWAVTMFGAVLLSAGVSMLMTISMFRTISGRGIARLLSAATYLLSGMVIPLPLFPAWAQPVLDFLPFRGIGDVPFRLFAGNIPVGRVGVLLAHQLAWAAALIIIGWLSLRRASRRLVVQGG